MTNPYHLYRCTDDNNNGNEDIDLQVIKDWRDINAPGKPIQDVTIAYRQMYDVKLGNVTNSFIDEAAADADVIARPGAVKTTREEEYEVEPSEVVPE